MPPSRARVADGAWHGDVIRIDGVGRLYVKATRLNRERTFGPCDVWCETSTPIVKGDRVLIVHVEGDPNRVAVIGRRVSGGA